MSDSDREKKESKEIGFFYNFFFLKNFDKLLFQQKSRSVRVIKEPRTGLVVLLLHFRNE